MKRVLLVEDNEANRDMLSRRLRLKGYEVVVAGDGQQALEQARREAPDLVLMDMSLPVMDGWEATRRLKASPETRSIPVVALTAHAMPQDRDKALAAGCDEYDTKPINLPRLLEKMAHLLGHGDPPPSPLPVEFGTSEVASAHALRTPLNHILGYSELLADALRSRASEDLVPDLERIQGAARTLLGLLDGRANPILGDGEVEPAPAEIPFPLVPEPATGVRPGRVLVVDDDPPNRDLLRRLLEGRGHRVCVASGGGEALQRADEESLDLILLDIVMPDMSGWEVLGRLKASPKTSDVPVVMISAVGEINAVGRCLQGGARDFISKPVEPVILTARVDACLESRWAQLREAELKAELEVATATCRSPKIAFDNSRRRSRNWFGRACPTAPETFWVISGRSTPGSRSRSCSRRDWRTSCTPTTGTGLCRSGPRSCGKTVLSTWSTVSGAEKASTGGFGRAAVLLRGRTAKF